MIFRQKDSWIFQSLLFPGNFLTFNSPSLLAKSDLTLKLFVIFEQGTKLTLKKMGGLYHQHRVEQGSGVCPSCCTSRAYSLWEVPPGSEKAEFCPKEPPEMCIDVMMFFFFRLVRFFFIYFKNCQDCALSFVCCHNFSRRESGLNTHRTTWFFKKELI